MYILVNEQLTKSQRIPQASHAVAEYVFENCEDVDLVDWIKNDRTMVVLQCNDERMKILSWGLRSTCFFDEDLDNMLTAVAFQPMTKEQGNKYFSKMRLA